MSLKKLGRYDIVKPLGKGAMGLVYEAHDPNINRAVAIKTIRVDQLSEEMAAEYESRFRSETQAGGRLQHPNIIGVYDAGRDQGLAYMVMELVRGGDLRQQLDQGRRLSFDRSMTIMKELLSALSFAHEQGIIHRDVKPANVMLDPNGRVKLGDFGVARITDGGEATRTQGSMVGTLKYMSPEQVIGAKVDSRSDLFAAGVVLYQLLTGTKPFEGDSDFAIMQAIAQQDPPPPSSLAPGLPAGVDTVVFKALAKDRDQRYASAKSFALALRAVSQQAAAGGSGGAVPNAGQSAGLAQTHLATPAAPTSPDGGTGQSRASSVDAGTSAPSSTSTSAVTQEMELLYWKDIQDSADPEDFQGFLQQFPTGVYAGLAQRRLRKLASVASERTGSQSVAETADQSALKATLGDAALRTRTEASPPPTATSVNSSSEVDEATRTASRSTLRTDPQSSDSEAARKAEARRTAEEAARRQVEDARRKADEARRAEQDRAAVAARKEEEQRLAREAQRLEEARQAEAANEAEAARQAKLADDARRAEHERLAREAEAAATARLAEQERIEAQAREAEAARLLEQERAAKAAKAADERRRAEDERKALEAKESEQAETARKAALAAQKAAQEREAEVARKAQLALEERNAREARVTAERAAQDLKVKEQEAAETARRATAEAEAQRSKLAEQQRQAELTRQAENQQAQRQAEEQALERQRKEAAMRALADKHAADSAPPIVDDERTRIGPTLAPKLQARPAEPVAPQPVEAAVSDSAIDAVLRQPEPRKAAATGQTASPPRVEQPKGNIGRLVAIGVAVALVVGGVAWFAMRDGDKKPAETAPKAPPQPAPAPAERRDPAPPRPAPEPTPVQPTPLPAETQPPLPTAAPPAPTESSTPLAQAKALERSDLKAAASAYDKIANGVDKAAASEAARRLWELYRDGGAGLPANPAQAQRWYDRARKMGVKLPTWRPEPAMAPAAEGSTTSPPVPPAPVPTPTQAPTPAPAPAPIPPTAPIQAPAPAPAQAPAPAPATSPAAVPAPAPPPVSTAPSPPVPAPAKSPSELFAQGQGLEGSNRNQALRSYRQAASQGYGPAQKRLWELLKDVPGSESEAARNHKEAWDQKVPGVPEPKGPVRF